MAVKTRDEILESVRSRLGGDTSDEAIALVEDIADTLTDLDNRTKDSTDWKKKYEENDASWRAKYRDRFFSGGSDDDDDDKDDAPKNKTYTYENLFKEG